MEPDAVIALQQASFSVDVFKNKLNDGTFSGNRKVVVHHNEGSISIPKNKLISAILVAAALNGNLNQYIMCSSLTFVNDKKARKNLKKLVIYCKDDASAKKILNLKQFSMGGHTVQISGCEIEKEQEEVKSVIKSINTSGNNPHTLLHLLEFLHDFATFSDETDVTINVEDLSLSITPTSFKKVVPAKRVYTNRLTGENHSVNIKATGYDDNEINSFLADKPKMSELFRKNKSEAGTGATEEWLGDNRKVIPKSRPTQIQLCHWCHHPGHKKFGAEGKPECPEYEAYLESLLCYRCGDKGHMSRNCKAEIPEGQKICFTCKKVGHEKWEKNKCEMYQDPTFREVNSRYRIRPGKGRARNNLSQRENFRQSTDTETDQVDQHLTLPVGDGDVSGDEGDNNFSENLDGKPPIEPLLKGGTIKTPHASDDEGSDNENTTKVTQHTKPSQPSISNIDESIGVEKPKRPNTRSRASITEGNSKSNPFQPEKKKIKPKVVGEGDSEGTRRLFKKNGQKKLELMKDRRQNSLSTSRDHQKSSQSKKIKDLRKNSVSGTENIEQ